MAELFDKKEFKSLRQWFLTIDMETFRSNAFDTGAIRHRQKLKLEALEIKGPTTHNDKLLDMVRETDSREAFKRLAEAVKEDFEPKYHEMMAILDLDKGSADGAGSSSSGAAVAGASHSRAVNGWQSQEYLRNYEHLLKRVHPRNLQTKCKALDLLGFHQLEDVDAERIPPKKNAIILKVLESSPGLFGTFREILHCTPSCRDIAKELDAVGPNRTTDQDCLDARNVLEKCGNVSTEEGSYRLLQLDSAEKAAESRNSEEREANPWKHTRFLGSTASLITKLTSIGRVRSLCFSNGLIDVEANEKLSHLRLKSTHNEELIRILQQGSHGSFAKFREVIRHMDSTNVFTEMLREWDSIGPSPAASPDKDPPPTVAKKTQRQFDDYDTSGSPRGIALIISNKNFNENVVCQGTDRDRDDLRKLWVGLNFQVEVLEDKTAGEMRAELGKLANLEGYGKDYSCVVVCILSHGRNKFVFGTDNERVRTEEMVELFSNDNVHLALRQKPKMFFIRACRGDKDEADPEPESQAAAATGTQHLSATAPGCINGGSLFIQTLVEVFVNHHNDHDVDAMMTMVKVACTTRSQGHVVPWKGGLFQMNVFLR